MAKGPYDNWASMTHYQISGYAVMIRQQRGNSQAIVQKQGSRHHGSGSGNSSSGRGIVSGLSVQLILMGNFLGRGLCLIFKC